MITDIARILRANNPNASAEWIQKLPEVARGLEDLFFRSEASFEEYRDRGTLKQRMQAAATAINIFQTQQHAAGPAPAAPPPPPRPAAQRTARPAPAPAAPRPALRRALSIRFHKVTEGEITIWPINPTAKLQQVFDTYTLKYRGQKGVRGQELIFYLDGALLHGGQTPEDVDMEDGDQIDVYGWGEGAPVPKPPKRPRHK